jgi:cold shock protein
MGSASCQRLLLPKRTNEGRGGRPRTARLLRAQFLVQARKVACKTATPACGSRRAALSFAEVCARRRRGGFSKSEAGRRGLALRRGVVARRSLPAHMRTRSLKTGTVKWFNPTKGYGFIQPDGGGADAFVHISAVERAGYDSLSEGQRVQYELVQGRNGKSSAENLKIVG